MPYKNPGIENLQRLRDICCKRSQNIHVLPVESWTDSLHAPSLTYTIRACEGFPKITWERTVTKATKKWSFHASEMLIAKIINIWQVGISVASFILKDLAMLCRLGKAQRLCLCLMKCSFLRVRMEQVFDSRKVHACFEESVTFCFWPHSRCWRLVEHLQAKAVQCSHCHYQEPLSAVSARRSGALCAFCSQSHPYEVKQKSDF